MRVCCYCGHLTVGAGQPSVVPLIKGDFWIVYPVPVPDDPKRSAIRWIRVPTTVRAYYGYCPPREGDSARGAAAASAGGRSHRTFNAKRLDLSPPKHLPCPLDQL